LAGEGEKNRKRVFGRATHGMTTVIEAPPASPGMLFVSPRSGRAGISDRSWVVIEHSKGMISLLRVPWFVAIRSWRQVEDPPALK